MKRQVVRVGPVAIEREIVRRVLEGAQHHRAQTPQLRFQVSGLVSSVWCLVSSIWCLVSGV